MLAAIENYLDWCRPDGAKLERSWSGKLTLRSDADLRRRVLITAAAHRQSVSAWLNQLAERESRRTLAELERET
jgi:predicted HicB family RNase H-like nuclease